MTPGIAGPFWRRPAFLAAIVITFAIPFLLGTIPPLIDLPAHIARYHVGAGLADSPFLQRYFTFEWRFMPNLGVDILVTGLSPLVGLEPAVRIIVATIPALMAAGMVWIAHEAHGAARQSGNDAGMRIPATALFALPLAFGYPMTFGFVNGCLANALALLAFGGWLHLSARGHIWQRSLVFALVAPLILTTHIVGYLLLGALTSGSILMQHLQRGSSIRAALVKTMIACLPIAWPLVVLFLWRTGSAPPPSGWLDWATKTVWLINILRDNWAPLDLLSAALVYGVMLLPFLLPRRFGYVPALAAPAIILWLAALLLPITLVTQFASVRLIYIATIITILAVTPHIPLPRFVAPLAIGFIVLRLASASISVVQADHRLARELTALDHVARGSRVLAFNAIDCDPAWAPPRFQHLPSLATVRRDAFVNDQFVTAEGQLMAIRADQPVLNALTRAQAIVFLRPCGRWHGRPVLADALARAPWSQVDYLWLIDVPAASRPVRPNLRLLWQQGDSSLFRVVPGHDAE